MADKRERLIDYLKKPAGYMAIVILIITVITSFWISFHFQAKKELTVQESQYNFLTRNKIDETDVNQHIQVYYDGKEIYDPYVVKITITNTGNQEITEDDFRSEKFEISFNKNVSLYDAFISNAIPNSISEEFASKLEIRDNRLLINPFLLNKEESFTLSLITNQETEIFYNFRIVGIRNIKKQQGVYIGINTIFLFGVSFLLFFTSTIYLFKFQKKPFLIISQAIGAISALIALLVSIYESTSEIAKNIQQFVFK